MTGWLALALAFPVAAQRFGDQVTVNVVEVPVHVERFGYPVAGLTKDDFALFVNGEPQAIDGFDVIDDRVQSPATEAAAPPPLDRRRLTVLLFDVGTMREPQSLARAQRAAARLVADAPSRDTFAVATIGRNGVRFLVPFTTDRASIAHAVATLTRSGARDPFSLAMLDVERASTRWIIGGGAESAASTFGDVWGTRFTTRGFADALESAERFEADEADLESNWFMRHLGILAERLAPLSGIKHVVLLSRRGGNDQAAGVRQSAMRMHARFRNAGVVLDAADVNSATNAPWPGLKTMPKLGPPSYLYTLALDTGGAVTQSLKTLEARNAITYLLVFQPHGPQKKTNAIRVELKNKRFLTDVRYRKSYSLDTPSDDADGLVLADTLTNDIPRNGVTLDVSVKGTEVAASIPGPELLALDAKMIDVFLYVFDERKLVAAWSHARLALDLEKGRDFLSAHPYTVRKEFTLGPGRYAAKALVRVVGSEAAGFRRADFIVPSP